MSSIMLDCALADVINLWRDFSYQYARGRRWEEKKQNIITTLKLTEWASHPENILSKESCCFFRAWDFWLDALFTLLRIYLGRRKHDAVWKTLNGPFVIQKNNENWGLQKVCFVAMANLRGFCADTRTYRSTNGNFELYEKPHLSKNWSNFAFLALFFYVHSTKSVSSKQIECFAAVVCTGRVSTLSCWSKTVKPARTRLLLSVLAPGSWLNFFVIPISIITQHNSTRPVAFPSVAMVIN